jgi:hypothetical protein
VCSGQKTDDLTRPPIAREESKTGPIIVLASASNLKYNISIDDRRGKIENGSCRCSVAMFDKPVDRGGSAIILASTRPPA